MARKDNDAVEYSAKLLLQKITQGDLSAERVLVRKYWRGLHYILLSKCRDPELTNDLVQDSFIIIISKARNNQIEKPDALASYIRQVGINLMLAHFRKEKRRATSSSEDIQIYSDDKIPGLFRHLTSEDIFKKIQQVVDEMPIARDKEILKNFFIYDKDKEEICAMLTLSSDHFDRVLHRARNRLKQQVLLELGPDNHLSDIIGILLIVSITPALLNPPPVTSVFSINNDTAFYLILMRELQTQ